MTLDVQNKCFICVKAVIRQYERLLIIKRSENAPIEANEWEFPGGGVEFSETCEEALTRELQEEVGLRLISCKLLYVTSFFVEPGSKIIALTYLAETEGIVSLSSEHQKFLWATEGEAQKLLKPMIYHDYKKFKKQEQINECEYTNSGVSTVAQCGSTFDKV
jgi:8-oxo-dGTP diphosphatase